MIPQDLDLQTDLLGSLSDLTAPKAWLLGAVNQKGKHQECSTIFRLFCPGLKQCKYEFAVRYEWQLVPT